MKKRQYWLALLLMMAMLLSACGSGAAPAEEAPEAPAEATAEPAPEATVAPEAEQAPDQAA